jgi:hypothetical protein
VSINTKLKSAVAAIALLLPVTAFAGDIPATDSDLLATIMAHAVECETPQSRVTLRKAEKLQQSVDKSSLEISKDKIFSDMEWLGGWGQWCRKTTAFLRETTDLQLEKKSYNKFMASGPAGY